MLSSNNSSKILSDDELLENLEGYNEYDFERSESIKKFLRSDLYNNIKEGDLLIGLEEPRNIEPPINLSDPNFDHSLLYSRRSDPHNIRSRPKRGLIEQYGISDFVGTHADLMEKLQNVINEEYNNSTKKRPSIFIVIEVQEFGPLHSFANLRQQNKIKNIDHHSEPNTIEYFSLPGEPTQWRDKKVLLLRIPVIPNNEQEYILFSNNSFDYRTTTKSVYDLYLKEYKRYRFYENEEWPSIKEDVNEQEPFVSTEPILKRIKTDNPHLLEKINKLGNRNILRALGARERGTLRGGFKKTKKK